MRVFRYRWAFVGSGGSESRRSPPTSVNGRVEEDPRGNGGGGGAGGDAAVVNTTHHHKHENITSAPGGIVMKSCEFVPHVIRIARLMDEQVIK